MFHVNPLLRLGLFLPCSDIFGIRGVFWGTPANDFADFGAILAIFDHFWAIFGLFLGRLFFGFFCRKMAFWPRYKAQKTEAQKTEIL